jgi:hypothetical protein
VLAKTILTSVNLGRSCAPSPTAVDGLLFFGGFRVWLDQLPYIIKKCFQFVLNILQTAVDPQFFCEILRTSGKAGLRSLFRTSRQACFAAVIF